MVLVGPTIPLTIRRTKQTTKLLTHELTPVYPYPPSYHARFLSRRASINNGSDPKLLLERSKDSRTADAAA